VVFVLWDSYNENLQGVVGEPGAKASSQEGFEGADDDADLIRCVDALGRDGNGLVSSQVAPVECLFHPAPEPEEREDQGGCRYVTENTHCEGDVKTKIEKPEMEG